MTRRATGVLLAALGVAAGLRFGPQGTTIRRATSRDFEAIRRCRSTPDPSGPKRVSPLFTNAWALRHEGAIGLVALARGSGVVGTADCLEVPAAANRPSRLIVKNVFVVPEFRGRGVGMKLMRATFDVARDLGAETLTCERVRARARALRRRAPLSEPTRARASSRRLQVDADNRPALRLYRSCGFKSAGLPGVVLDACTAIGLQLRVKFSADVRAADGAPHRRSPGVAVPAT